MKYGFVGLGHLGGNLAASLLRGGFALIVYDRDPQQVARLVGLGAQAAGSAAQVAGQVDAVVTCLPSPAVSALVLEEIVLGAKPGLAWIEMSTNDRDNMLALAQIASRAGIAVLECPVTGGVHKAASGEITVIVGGDDALFATHRPALATMGGQIFHVGPLGAAAVIKVITNMLAFIHLAKKGGLDLAQAYEVIRASSGNSFVHETESQLILNGSYNINFTMDLACKDLGFAMGFGRAYGVPLELAGVTEQSFIAGRAAYGGQAQSTQIVRLLEDTMKTDLRAPGFPAQL